MDGQCKRRSIRTHNVDIRYMTDLTRSVDWKCTTWRWRTIEIAWHENEGSENDGANKRRLTINDFSYVIAIALFVNNYWEVGWKYECAQSIVYGRTLNAATASYWAETYLLRTLLAAITQGISSRFGRCSPICSHNWQTSSKDSLLSTAKTNRNAWAVEMDSRRIAGNSRFPAVSRISTYSIATNDIAFSARWIVALLPWCSSVRLSVRLSVWDGRALCDHTVHFSADLSLRLDIPMFCAPWHQNMSYSYNRFSSSTWKRGEVWLCKLGEALNANTDKKAVNTVRII